MKIRSFAKSDILVLAALGGLSAAVYFLSLAGFAFPGESAHLQAVWRGLDVAANPEFPLAAVFAKALGGGNLIAPVCGVLATLLVYLNVAFFVRERVTDDGIYAQRTALGRLAGVISAVVFMLTPAVRSAATHLEPRLFDVCWLLLTAALFVPYALLPRALALLCPVLMGVLAALGLCDSVIFAVFAPFALFALVRADLEAGNKPYPALGLFTASFIVAFFVARANFGLDFGAFVRGSWKELVETYTASGWVFTALFATVPFFAALLSCRRAFGSEPTSAQSVFHGVMALFAVMAVATPLSPSAQMSESGELPVLTSLFAAAVTGYVGAYWWSCRRTPAGMGVGAVFGFVISFACLWNLFSFDARRGAFADEVAKKILADLGPRCWFVSDGTLDDHLRLCAADAGRDLTVVSLSRDLDEDYLERLGRIVREKRIGGSKNEQLALSLKLGVLPFVQDWFAADPSVVEEVAIFGAPDLWYAAGFTPVPELLFFGADEKREPAAADYAPLLDRLKAPKGWGSYRVHETKDPVARLRLQLRRHLGLVANNRGVYLQDRKRDDEAFEMYEKVLGEIDRDNVCSLFNEIEMAGANHPKAKAKKAELERRVKTIVDDKDRRYVIWRLGYYYGYIRNPDMFMRLGFSWAKSGRAGEALAQIRRAIDFVPADRQHALLNMMASLYANDNDKEKSRKIYHEVLEKNEKDHDALIGMMRLELLDGDSKKALEYLEKAAAVSPAEGRRAKTEFAMVAMMKNDFDKATELLKKLTDEDPKDLQAWSLLASVLMQRWDAAKDNATKAEILKELSNRVLPSMEKQSANPYDYYVQTTKAFLLIRQGEAKRREARDAFAAAMRARPDSAATQNMVLGLDISLDDKVNAEHHARSVLRLNRDAPLANYVMGSLAIGRGEYVEAEAFLRKAVKAEKPNMLALNDMAEVLRRQKKFGEAERFARQATEVAPKFYIVWETLGVVLLDRKGDVDEAERCIRKAIELSKAGDSKVEDLRLYISLARVQFAKGDEKGARASVRRVQSHVSQLSDFEKKEFEEIRKRVR